MAVCVPFILTFTLTPYTSPANFTFFVFTVFICFIIAMTSPLPHRFQVICFERNVEEKTLVLSLSSTIAINDKFDRYQAILKSFWANTNVTVECIIHILSPKVVPQPEESVYLSTLIVDGTDGLVVVEPDKLISATQITSATYCLRKTWLSKFFQAGQEYSRPLMVGTLVHDLFQTSLRRQYSTLEQVRNLFRTELLPQCTLSLYALKMTQADLIKEVQPYLQSTVDWLTTYAVKNKESDAFTFHSLHDTENNVWSPKYGLLGNIDVSLRVYRVNKFNGNISRYLVPLELKTGEHTRSAQHYGQIILYLWIMAEKYKIDHAKLGEGYLLYLKNNYEMISTELKPMMFRDLIRVRNELVQYYEKLAHGDVKNISSMSQFKVKGPELLGQDNVCEKCDHLLDCALVDRCFEDKNKADGESWKLGDDAVCHLQKSELDFFQHMVSLLEYERLHSSELDPSDNFWYVRSDDCERVGIGLAKLEIKSQTPTEVCFERHTKVAERKQLPRKLLAEVEGFNYATLTNRRVMISEELLSARATYESNGQFCSRLCVAMGFISRFSADCNMIEVAFKKELLSQLKPDAIYRIDFLKSNTNAASVINFSNLLRLMEPDNQKSAELRSIVMSGKFLSTSLPTSASCGVLQNIYHSPLIEGLNRNQKQAVVGVLRTKCSLIFGCPGAGKTQTIVALVQVIVQAGFSVLLTGYTHVAVDNVLLKLVEANERSDQKVEFVRMGYRDRIHQGIQQYTDEELTKQWCETNNVAELDRFYQAVPVVACTCLGITKHPIFTQRKFDFCILDEASQAFLPTTLGPFFLSDKLVLVGDQNQLPPVVRSKFAKANGLELTLFSRLMSFVRKEDNFTDTTTDLSNSPKKLQFDRIRVFPLFIQYRMNRVIMEVTNRLTYNNKLSCGSAEVEAGCLEQFLATNEPLLDTYRESYLWKAINPQLEDSFVFLDTDTIAQASETCINTSQITLNGNGDANDSFLGEQGMHVKHTGCVFNMFEAHLIVNLVQTIMSIYGKSGNFNETNIGVVSPFLRQVQIIRDLFGLEYVRQHHLEVNTVDQYQGRDKDVIIYSCVKSHCQADYASQDSSDSDSALSGDVLRDDLRSSAILKDERRLNVAITRAKKKLIIVGNRQTLVHYEPFKKLFNVLSEQQFVKVCKFNYDDTLNNLTTTTESFPMGKLT